MFLKESVQRINHDSIRTRIRRFSCLKDTWSSRRQESLSKLYAASTAKANNFGLECLSERDWFLVDVEVKGHALKITPVPTRAKIPAPHIFRLRQASGES